MTDSEVAAVGDFLAERRDDIVDLLIELANLESPSLVPESQHATQELLTRRLKAIGFAFEFLPGEKTGGHVYLSPEALDGAGRGGVGAPVQLLLGHTDTVWPIGTVYHMPVEWDEEEDRIRGPGVFDMKAGIVQMVIRPRGPVGTRARAHGRSHDLPELR